ncbi:MAG: ABC transporter permease [Bacteroidetes bacterium]|nr:ABC transporter permease [Bacteroidota bacterium]
MVKNLINISIRYFLKNQGYSSINVFGLGLGLATCILIFLFLQDELSYDKFHENASNIYRVETHIVGQGEDSHWAASTGNLIPFIQENYPEVQAACKLNFSFNQDVLSYGDLSFREENMVWADSTFFDVFSFEIIKGNKIDALSGPAKLVFTESTAKKYFGNDDPIGKIIKLYDRSFQVTAVIKDVPSNSHFHFNIIVAMDDRRRGDNRVDRSMANAFYSYVRVKDEETMLSFKEKLDQRIWEILGYTVSGDSTNIPEGTDAEFILQSITDIHLNGHAEKEIKANGDKQYVISFSIIALFVLTIACINYMNLATARSAKRGREVGVRKVLGANRSNIFRQFMGESYVMSLLALMIAIVIVEIVLPGFNVITGKTLTLSVLANLPLLGSIIVIFLFVGFISGSYPSLFLSNFNPLVVLKSNTISGHSKTALFLRRGLVILQFSISIILIIGALIIYAQIKYIQNKDLGFDKKDIVVLRLTNTIREEQISILKNEFKSIPEIASATGTSVIPGDRVHFLTVRLPDQVDENIQTTDEDGGVFTMRVLLADEDVINTFGIQIKEGRGFSSEFGTDSDAAFLINEAAVEWLELKDPVGTRFEYLYALPQPKKGQIIGVMKNFHYASLHADVEPIMIHISPMLKQYLSIKVNSKDVKNVIALIEQKWVSVFPSIPFEYFLLESSYNEMYKSEINMGQIITYFTFLAILIACLGLFGLASYIMEQRTKEIGIRKTLGASMSSIIRALSKEFIILVAISNIIAFVPAYILMRNWLNNFYYRIDISIWVFIVTAILSITIALITIGSQALIAARENPVKSLKYE